MKEYIAKTGGRYTYIEDVINLQDMARSMSEIFGECSDFIISGCEVKVDTISPGFVWINGKVRHFEGVTAASFPYYLYEKNEYESTTYANEVNQQGRCNYLCLGGLEIPQVNDPVTGRHPQFIKVTEEYAPRLIDKFFGKYAVLLENPFAKQTVKGELILSGSFQSDKDISARGSVGVINPEGTLSFKNSLNNTRGSLGLYKDNLSYCEISFTTGGEILFLCDRDEVGKFSSNGLVASTAQIVDLSAGKLKFHGDSINSDTGTIKINSGSASSAYKDFIVYNGKQNQILSILGDEATIHSYGNLIQRTTGEAVSFINSVHEKTAKQLINFIGWRDLHKNTMATIGYCDGNSFNFTISSDIGNILLKSLGYVDIIGEFRLAGKDIGSIYVDWTQHHKDLAGKVDKMEGKQLSSEDFTPAHKKKLEGITQSSLGTGSGFVSAKDVHDALLKKMDIEANLSDIPNKAEARKQLDIYSKTEGDDRYYRRSNYLSEIITISSEDAQDLSADQIIQLRDERAAMARANLFAEKAGSADLRLLKSANLSDLTDVSKARSTLNVYSKTEIDTLLGGKLSVDDGYEGVVFTTEHRNKLESIKTGTFAGKTPEGATVTQIEGYVTTSAVVGQLALKANRLLDGYSTAEKSTVAANIAVYTKTEADGKYGQVSSSFQDYITYLTGKGSTTTNAQKTLRDKIGAAAATDLNNYLSKSGKLADLTVSSDTDRKNICTRLGAAYAPDYQTKLNDTGWQSCGGSNSGTLFVRQIGNMVCIQGMINTAKRTGGEQGGVVATIPNSIQPPRYSCKTTLTHWDNNDKRNRGTSLVILANSRTIYQYTAGWDNKNTEVSITYMV